MSGVPDRYDLFISYSRRDNQTFPEMAVDAAPGHPDPWKNVLRTLFSLRLLQATDVLDASHQPLVARVHRLVQQVTLQDCSSTTRESRQKAVDGLVGERHSALRKTTAWENTRWELEPLDALASLWAETQHSSAAWALNQMGVRWHHLAEWSRAEPLMRRALDIDEHSFGPQHPTVAIRLNNLATLLQATNRLAEAEPLMRRALHIDEHSFGPQHPTVAIRLNNLATLLQATNRLAEAEPLMRRALDIVEHSFGPQHPNVANHLNNLASLLQDTNRLAEAEPLMRRVLEIFLDFTRASGHPHPHLQAVFGNYAELLRATGLNDNEIREQLNAMLQKYGMSLGQG